MIHIFCYLKVFFINVCTKWENIMFEHSNIQICGTNVA